MEINLSLSMFLFSSGGCNAGFFHRHPDRSETKVRRSRRTRLEEESPVENLIAQTQIPSVAKGFPLVKQT